MSRVPEEQTVKYMLKEVAKQVSLNGHDKEGSATHSLVFIGSIKAGKSA